MKEPKLRNVEKHKPPYPLNSFSRALGVKLGKDLIYHLIARGDDRLTGEDWEQIFANLIGAAWKPSAVGLDDIVLKQCAWSTKTLKSSNPFAQKTVRIIAGRNSPDYSFGISDVRKADPNKLGRSILAIWNSRVAGVKQNYEHLRSVVLLKGPGLREVSVFETNVQQYHQHYEWLWNRNDNLTGGHVINEKWVHLFTWQPHGAQFTLIEEVPHKRLKVRIKPTLEDLHLDKEKTLKAMGYTDDWIEVVES